MYDSHLLLCHLLLEGAKLEKKGRHACRAVAALHGISRSGCSTLGCLALQRVTNTRYVWDEAELQLKHLCDTSHVRIADNHFWLVQIPTFLVIVEDEVSCLTYATREFLFTHVLWYAGFRYKCDALCRCLDDKVKEGNQSVDVSLLVNDGTDVWDDISVHILEQLVCVGMAPMLVRVVILLKNKAARSKCLVMPEHIKYGLILYEGNIRRVYALRCSLLQAYRILLLDDGYLLWIYLVERIVKVKNILTSVAHLMLLSPHMIHAAHSWLRGIP